MFHEMGFGWMGFGWLLWIAVTVIIVFFITKYTNSQKSIYTQNRSDESPLDILKKRYAKGEISKEDFDKIKKDLT